MKALTICQPYAHLILQGRKTCENRTWYTPYRGPLYIHAGKSRDWLDADDNYGISIPDMAFGAVIAIAELVACVRDDERMLPRWLDGMSTEQREHVQGPYCWFLDRVRPVGPWPWRGAQRLWDINVTTDGENCGVPVPAVTEHDWTGPKLWNRHVHCARCGKIFEINKAKGVCTGAERET